MTNDPKADLIYAILTLDSYNRGYGSGISDSILPESGKIGSWTIGTNATEEFGSDAFDTGFYAISYKKGNEKVIAYRGTDVKGLSDSATKGGSDPRYGYGIALGLTPDSLVNAATDQADLAAKFYASVTGKTEGQAAGNVVVTGHSLGGGLAGYIGAVSNVQAITFDHMVLR